MDPEFALSRTQLPLAFLYRHARETPERAALMQAGRQISYGELLQRVQVAAARLAAAGVQAEDRVVLLAGNSLDYPVAVYAVGYLGALIVPINFRLATGEIAYILQDCTPRVVLADEERVAAAQDAARDAGSQVLGLSAVTACDGPLPVVLPPAAPAADADQAIMYTSGTTGRPKGAVLTYGNVLAASQAMFETWNFVPGEDVILVVTPMFHIAAFNVLRGGLNAGVTLLVAPSMLFDADQTLDLIERERVTHTFMVPAQWQMMIDAQQQRARDLSSLKLYVYGAAPATRALLVALSQTFTSGEPRQAFGQTETTASGVSLAPQYALSKLGSVGLPDRRYSVRVVDGNMQDVPRGEVGEIVYRGPGVMSRYWNNEAATAEAFHGGWFHSGDLVRQDEDGFIYVVDRAKDMIISGGENIYSAELESVVASHPQVLDVAIVGRADEKWGEIPVAVVVPRDPADAPTLEEIRAFCDGKLARYKQPRALRVIEQFPRTGTGKIQKNLLRQQVSEDA